LIRKDTDANKEAVLFEHNLLPGSKTQYGPKG